MDSNFENDPDIEVKAAAGDAAGKEKRAGKKKHRGLKVVLIILILLVVIVGVAAGIAAHYANKMLNSINYTHDPIDPYDTAPIAIDTLPPRTYAPPATATPEGMTPDPEATDTPYDPYAEDTLRPDETYADPSAVATIESQIGGNEEVELMLDDSVYSVMLIGSDTRDITTFRGNSDAMILLSVNNNTNEIWLTSFMRDTYLYIPGVGNNKLNFAYARSGAKLLLRTIQENYRVGLSRYAIVTFDAFKDIVDALGGVTLTVTDDEAQYIPGISEGGTYRLTGSQVLSYSRIRAIGTDFARTERQRNVLEAIIADMKGKSVSELTDVLNALLPYVTTNIPKSEITAQIAQAAKYYNYNVRQLRIPVDGTWRYDILPVVTHVVIVTDFRKNIDAIRDNVFAGVY